MLIAGHSYHILQGMGLGGHRSKSEHIRRVCNLSPFHRRSFYAAMSISTEPIFSRTELRSSAPLNSRGENSIEVFPLIEQNTALFVSTLGGMSTYIYGKRNMI